MSSRKDPLFRIFEQHLFNAMVEDETTDDFLSRVVSEYTKLLTSQGSVPHDHRDTLTTDLREEVLEMLRKTTYGHFSLSEFRKKKAADLSAANQNLSSNRASSGEARQASRSASGPTRPRRSS